MVPKPRVWLVSSEDRITVGGLAPVSSVRRAVTVTVFSPSLSSTVLGLKSNSVTTGAATSAGVLLMVSLVGWSRKLELLFPMVSETG